MYLFRSCFSYGTPCGFCYYMCQKKVLMVQRLCWQVTSCFRRLKYLEKVRAAVKFVHGWKEFSSVLHDTWSPHKVVGAEFFTSSNLYCLDTVKWMHYRCNKKQYQIALQKVFVFSLSHFTVWFRLYLDIYIRSSCLVWHHYLFST